MWINLAKEVSDICNDNYKASMGATGEDTKLQGFTPFPGA